MKNKKIKSKGVALISALVVVGVFVILIGAMLTFLEREYFYTSRNYKVQQALALSEAGIDKATQTLTQNPNYEGETDTHLGNGTFTVAVSGFGDSRVIESTGKVAGVEKIIRIQAAVAIDKVEFHYGAQVGQLGLVMSNQSKILGKDGAPGNVYSNGSITPDSGGSTGEITGDVFVAGTGIIQNVQVGNDAHAYSFTGGNKCKVTRNLYYYYLGQVDCTYGSKIPQYEMVEEKSLPIPPETIQKWENEAAAGQVINQDLKLDGISNSYGPVKINGNLTVTNKAILTVTGTIWVTGNILIDNGATVKLDSAYGAKSGVIIADNHPDPYNKGTITTSNNVNVIGSGASGSYLMLLSTNKKSDIASPAISAANNSTSAIVYASAGRIALQNNATLKEVTGYGLFLKNGAQIIYESGLASAGFVSGPGGSWGIKRQTWTLIK